MHLIVSNIPENFRSRDLRNFFSEFIEQKAFTCFHFRHRPQSQMVDIIKRSSVTQNSGASGSNMPLNSQIKSSYSGPPHIQTAHTERQGNDERNNSKAGIQGTTNKEGTDAGNETMADGSRNENDDSHTHWLNSGLAGLASLIREKKQQVTSHTKSLENAGRTCCVIDVKDGLVDTFFKKYNHKHWVTHEGDILPQRCYLLRVDFRDPCQVDAADDDYKTRQELRTLRLEPGPPQELIEFRPPPVMPQGNVGTPTHHFRELIRTCQMPGTLIKKLGLEFSRGRRKRRFGQVPFDYGTSVSSSQEQMQGEGDIAFTAAGHLIPSSADFEKERKRRRRKEKRPLPKGPRMELEEETEDGAEVEEWERYEPFHEDITSQDRIKERRFEEELEVVWEKGGSGLVFYTDAQFWRAQEGDFDEQTADEWDVDMSVYYEEESGDKDARDGLEMRTSDKLRAGSIKQSVFKRKEDKESLHQAKKGKGRRVIGPTPPPTIGSFEAHTKGFGRRLMEAQGWKEGQGLGVGAAGMPYALESEGQHPLHRKGFGYHGEKLQAWASTTSATSSKPKPHHHHHISTIFDRAEDADPPPSLLRTSEPTTLTHRTHPR